MDLYRFGRGYSYTPDIEIKKKGDKFGIVYLPTDEILLPFKYENIMINGEATNNFFVVKNGLVGAVHLKGVRCYKNDFFIAERCKLPTYIRKPDVVYDVPCKYDYFVVDGVESIFFNNKENVYLYVGKENTVIHFEEIYADSFFSIWGKKDNMLHLISMGEIRYKEPFKGFRFYDMPNYCAYMDFENNEKLTVIEGKYTLIKFKDYSSLRRENLCFNNKIIDFEYYSKPFNVSSERIEYTTELLGIREKGGTRITFPFAHTLIYVGKNRFIANCENGKFALCEVKYLGQVEICCKTENSYDLFPEFILEGYDFVNILGEGCYEFIKENAPIAIYNANNGSIKNSFYE